MNRKFVNIIISWYIVIVVIQRSNIYRTFFPRFWITIQIVIQGLVIQAVVIIVNRKWFSNIDISSSIIFNIKSKIQRRFLPRVWITIGIVSQTFVIILVTISRCIVIVIIQIRTIYRKFFPKVWITNQIVIQTLVIQTFVIIINRRWFSNIDIISSIIINIRSKIQRRFLLRVWITIGIVNQTFVIIFIIISQEV